MAVSDGSSQAAPPPVDMTDDDLLEEVMETVRLGRNHGTWDGERLRSFAAEVDKRDLLPNAFKQSRTV